MGDSGLGAQPGRWRANGLDVSSDFELSERGSWMPYGFFLLVPGS